MILTAAIIRLLAEKGLSASDIADVAEAAEPVRSSHAERQARYSAHGSGKIPEDLRMAVFERDGWVCLDCGADDNLCCDPVIPVSRGGETSFENLQTLCIPCHRRKKDRVRKRDGRRVRGMSAENPRTLPPIEDNHTPQSDISPDGESQTQRDVRAIQQIWNEMAKANGLATCSRIAGKRLTACKARLRSDGLEAIRLAVDHVPKSSFLLGRTGNWGGATINFLLKPDSVTKILEGQYDDRAKPCQANRNSYGTGDGRSSLAKAIDEGLDNFGERPQAQVFGDLPPLGNPFQTQG